MVINAACCTAVMPFAASCAANAAWQAPGPGYCTACLSLACVVSPTAAAVFKKKSLNPKP